MSEIALKELKRQSQTLKPQKSDLDDEMRQALELSKQDEQERERQAREEEEMIRLAIEASMQFMKDSNIKVQAAIASKESVLEQ